MDISPSLEILGGSPGKFQIDGGALSLDVADVLTAEASEITIQYNPEVDTDGDGTTSAEEQAAYDNQEILKLNSVSVTITPLNLTGSLSPYTSRRSHHDPGTCGA